MLQGLAGGGLQPSSQGVLLDAFPPEKQGSAMTLFGIAALIGPIVGPTLGGWLIGQLQLALDLLRQRPGRPASPWPVNWLLGRRSGLPQEAACRVAPPSR